MTQSDVDVFALRTRHFLPVVIHVAWIFVIIFKTKWQLRAMFVIGLQFLMFFSSIVNYHRSEKRLLTCLNRARTTADQEHLIGAVAAIISMYGTTINLFGLSLYFSLYWK